MISTYRNQHVFCRVLEKNNSKKTQNKDFPCESSKKLNSRSKVKRYILIRNTIMAWRSSGTTNEEMVDKLCRKSVSLSR